MASDRAKRVAELLARIRKGDRTARDELVNLLYKELMRIAHGLLRREPPGVSLQTSDLVHEAYLRLFPPRKPLEWENRGHSFGAASRAMRQILVDRANARKRRKRGGGQKPVPLTWEPMSWDADPTALLALDEALKTLQELDPRKCAVVHLR